MLLRSNLGKNNIFLFGEQYDKLIKKKVLMLRSTIKVQKVHAIFGYKKG